jgi:hypothetical protein
VVPDFLSVARAVLADRRMQIVCVEVDAQTVETDDRLMRGIAGEGYAEK